MTTTNLLHEITTNTYMDDKVGSVHNFLVEQLVTTMLHDGKPVTAWDVSRKLGDDYAKQAPAILGRLTNDGALIRFKVGFINYYAPPTAALVRDLVSDGPTLGTIVLDSLKGLLPCLGTLIRHK
ncbi:MAG: hypothetical protein V3V23_08320 [Dehalococcoidales bacterium]